MDVLLSLGIISILKSKNAEKFAMSHYLRRRYNRRRTGESSPSDEKNSSQYRSIRRKRTSNHTSFDRARAWLNGMIAPAKDISGFMVSLLQEFTLGAGSHSKMNSASERKTSEDWTDLRVMLGIAAGMLIVGCCINITWNYFNSDYTDA